MPAAERLLCVPRSNLDGPITLVNGHAAAPLRMNHQLLPTPGRLPMDDECFVVASDPLAINTLPSIPDDFPLSCDWTKSKA